MAAIEELYALLGWKLEGEGDLKKFKSGMKGLEKDLDAFAKRAAKFAISIGTIMAGATAAFGKSVISTSAQFESYAATLETIEGSSEKAKASLDWIAEFAKTTPYDVAQATEAFVRMRAYGLDPMDGSLTAVGNAASAMGKTLMDGVEAIADATTGENERLKAFGITAAVAGDKITYTWRQNGVEMSKTLKKSGLEIAKFLKENFDQRFSGAMLRQSKTWNGMLANLSDSWVDFQLRVGEGGFFDTVKGHLGDLLDYIGKLDSDGTLDRWSKSLSTGLTSAVEFGKGQIQGLIKDFEFLRSWFGDNPDWIAPLKAAFFALGTVLFPVTSSLLVLQDVFRYLQGRSSFIGDFAKQLEGLTGIDASVLGGSLSGVALAGAGLMLAVGPTKAMAAAVRGLAGAMGLLGASGAAKGLGVFTALGAALRGAAGFLIRNPLLTAGAVAYNALDAVPHDAMAAAVKDDPELPARLAAERNRWQGVHFEGGRHRAGLGAGPAEGNPIRNYLDHSDYLQGGGAARAVVNDNSDRSIHVKATATVSVNEVNQAATASGREVENAVRNALGNRGASRASRFEKDDAF